jgi:pSer/pThr/pTyr-binding forkhead associated (FHA) protein
LNFIPAYPRIEAIIREDKTGELTVNGTSRPIVAADLARLRAGVIARCAAVARQVHRPVRVRVVDIAGTYAIAIHPDAFVQILDDQGNTPDIGARSPRLIANSPCRRCGAGTPLSATTCSTCGSDNAHDVLAAPASARITAPILISADSARAEPAELLARWAVPATTQDQPATTNDQVVRAQSTELNDDAKHTIVKQQEPPSSFPVLRFTTAQSLTLHTSAIIGRNPKPNDGESAVLLFKVDDPTRTVSKVHFRIDWNHGQLMIVDRHSGNGIVVEHSPKNPKTLIPAIATQLYNGDHVLIGDQAFDVTIARPSQGKQT